MRRFLVEPSAISAGRAVLTGPQFHHAARVLRLRADDVVALFDPAGREYLARIRSVGREEMRLDILREIPGQREPSFSLTVVQSIVKASAMDFILQKCSELGAARLIAAPTERSTARVPRDRIEARRQRWQRIADQSAEQCGRLRPMSVEIAPGLDAALRRTSEPLIALHEAEKARGLADVVRACRGANSASAFVGPEGGFSPAEIQRFKDAGAAFAGLGPRILRAETAALVATALIMYELGDLGKP